MPPKNSRSFKTPGVLKDPSSIPVNTDIPAPDQDVDKKTLYARLSRSAYGKEPPPEGWNRVDKHSDRNKSLYEKDGKYVLAFRGTDLTSRNAARDLGADALLALGAKRLSSRFRGAASTARRVVNEYGRENVVLTGHSLGASSAGYAAQKLGLQDGGVEAHLYAPGVALSDMKRTGGMLKVAEHVVNHFDPPGNRLRLGDNHHAYAAKGDVISSLIPYVEGGNVEVQEKRVRNPHSLQNFTSD